MTKPPAYTPLAGHYDEMVDADGALRSHWQAMTNALCRGRPSRDEPADAGNPAAHPRQRHDVPRPEARGRPGTPLAARRDSLRHRRRRVGAPETGGRPARRAVRSGARRPLRPAATHTHGRTARGLAAREPGLSAAMRRLAASRRTLAAPLCRRSGAGARRGAGGCWATAPKRRPGSAFALENRIVVNTVLPDVLVASKVRRLAGTFETRRTSLAASAPGHRQNPRIVVLTPGPASENYFEHAFLARYMGYTLVEGTDLTVRDYRVYIKTLGGLQPVDLILRSQPSEALRPPSSSGGRRRAACPDSSKRCGAATWPSSTRRAPASPSRRRVMAFPAGAVPPAAGCGAAAALGGHLVVRRRGGARACARPPRQAGDQAGLSQRAAGTDVRTAPARGAARPARGPHRPPAPPLRGAGADRPLDDPGSGGRRPSRRASSSSASTRCPPATATTCCRAGWGGCRRRPAPST